MKYLSTVLLFIFCFIDSYSQIYRPPQTYGIRENRIMIDSSFHLPLDTSRMRTNNLNPGAIVYNTLDSSLWSWTGSTWIKQGRFGSIGRFWALNTNELLPTDTFGAINNQSIKIKSGNYAGEISGRDWIISPQKAGGSLVFIKNLDTTSINAAATVSLFKPILGTTTNARLTGFSLFPYNNYTTIAAHGPTWFYGFNGTEKRGYLTFAGRDEQANIFPYFTINTKYLVGLGRIGISGSIDATAILQIAPGVDSIPALKLMPGQLLTNQQKGAFEYVNNGGDTAIYFTLNNQRRKFVLENDAINNQLTYVQQGSARISGTYAKGDSLSMPGTSSASFYNGEIVNQHAHYAFVDNGYVRYTQDIVRSAIGRAAFNDNSHYEGVKGSDHIHSYQSYLHYNTPDTVNRISGFWMQPDIQSGVVTELSQFRASNPLGAGIIRNLYGIYIPTLTRGQNNFGVYVEGGMPSYFGSGFGVGTTSPLGLVHVLGNTTGSHIIQNTSAFSTSSGAYTRYYNTGTPTAAGQNIGGIAMGSNPSGSTVRIAAQIDAISDAVWTDGSSHPSVLRFFTTTSGSAFVSEKMRITNSGNIGIGTASPNSTLHTNGSISNNIITITSNTTIGINNYTILSNGASIDITVTLPNATTCSGRIYCIKKINSGNSVIIQPVSSQTIDGSVSTTITTQWQSIQIQSNGSNWFIL